MPAAHRQKSRAKPARARPRAPAKKPAAKAKPASKAPPPKPAAKSSGKAAPKVSVPELQVPSPDGRRHVLSLSFVRDGDEFLARLETDAGHITELKNRALDQLLTLVASELEDLLE
jgi:hypothetical protein